MPDKLSPHQRIWARILVYLALVYASLPFLPAMVEGLSERFGELAFEGALWALLVPPLGWLAWGLRQKPRRIWAEAALAGLLVVLVLSLSRAPVEKVHLVVYGLLGFWVGQAWPGREQLHKALAFILAAGGTDELIQYFLPMRHGDLTDVLFNFSGGVLGLWLERQRFS